MQGKQEKLGGRSRFIYDTTIVSENHVKKRTKIKMCYGIYSK